MNQSTIKTDLSRMFALMEGHRLVYFLLTFGRWLPNTILNVGVAFAMKQVVDYFTIGDAGSLRTAIGVGVGLVVGGVSLFPFLTHLCNAERERIMRDIRVRLFRHLQVLPVAYYERQHSGDVLSRVNKDTEEFSEALFALEASVGMTAGLLTIIPYLLVMDWRFGLIGMAVSAIAATVNLRYIKPMRDESRTIHEKTAALAEAVTESVTGFDVIKSYGLAALFLGRFDSQLAEVVRAQTSRVRIDAIVASANTLMGWTNQGLLAVIGCYLVIQGSMEVGVLVGSLPVCMSLSGFLMFVSQQMVTLQRSFAGTDRLYELLEEAAEPRQLSSGRLDDGRQGGAGRAAGAAGGAGKAGGAAGIRFEAVRFEYADELPVLHGISFSVPRGGSVALVGDSGGGKTTVIKLTMGLYLGWEGTIELLGKPVGDYELEQWRDLVAYVPQDAYVFDGTIRDNIRYGRPEAAEEEIVAAATDAYAHDFITEKPDGYDTLVGERGIRLSGGERQRVAIARAMLKDAPVLLLDEATSSLDSQAEEAVQRALVRLMRDRTSLVVAHRLSTIEHADVIYVLSSGRIVESGSHGELLEEGGVYRELYYRQWAEPRR